MNETMSESQLLWLVADKAEQCAAHDAGLAVLLRALAAVSGGTGNGKDHVDKIVEVAEPRPALTSAPTAANPSTSRPHSSTRTRLPTAWSARPAAARWPLSASVRPQFRDRASCDWGTTTRSALTPTTAAASQSRSKPARRSSTSCGAMAYAADEPLSPSAAAHCVGSTGWAGRSRRTRRRDRPQLKAVVTLPRGASRRRRGRG
jgi:hypothetical protein